MRQLLLIPILLATFSFSVFTQSAQECPTISIYGPSGIVNPGKVATYIATVDTKGNQLLLEYNWSVSAGTIIAGQGTATLQVKVPEQTFTVTVDILGLPNGCASAASETAACGLTQPEAVKLGQFAGPITEPARIVLDEAVKAANENPNGQLYILSGRIGGKQSDGVLANEARVLDYLESKGLERSQVTIVGVYAENPILQFWLVPPGADIPRCEECEDLEKAARQQSCPSISITGSPGIKLPGEIVTFQLSVGNTAPGDLRYIWTTTGGEIVRGQGTTSIGLIYRGYPLIDASVKILGLPAGCADTASERYEISIDPGPLELGMIPGPAYRIDENLLNRIIAGMQEQPNAQLYVYLYLDLNLSKRASQSIRKRLSTRFVKEGIDLRALTFVTGPKHPNATVFQLVPIGVSAPPP